MSSLNHGASFSMKITNKIAAVLLLLTACHLAQGWAADDKVQWNACGGSTYFYHQGRQPFTIAKKVCQLNDAKLAAPKTEEEDKCFLRMKADSKATWLGIFKPQGRRNRRRSYRYVANNNTRPNASNSKWLPRMPMYKNNTYTEREMCLVYDFTNKKIGWEDVECSDMVKGHMPNHHEFVCEKKEVTVPRRKILSSNLTAFTIQIENMIPEETFNLTWCFRTGGNLGVGQTCHSKPVYDAHVATNITIGNLPIGQKITISFPRSEDLQLDLTDCNVKICKNNGSCKLHSQIGSSPYCDCPKGFIGHDCGDKVQWNTCGRSTYVYHQVRQPFTIAKKFCQLNDAKLAAPKTEEENKCFLRMKADSKATWLGIFKPQGRRNRRRSYRYVANNNTGPNASNSKWLPRMPMYKNNTYTEREMCLVYNVTNKKIGWEDVECSDMVKSHIPNHHEFVCEKAYMACLAEETREDEMGWSGTSVIKISISDHVEGNWTILTTDCNVTERVRLELHSTRYISGGSFQHLPHLLELDIANNRLRNLPVGVFAGLKNLQHLAIRHNSNLRTLPLGLFNGLADLSWLHIKHNPLESLPEGIFSGLNITELLISHHRIARLPVGLFHGLQNLHTLSFENSAGSVDFPVGIFDGLYYMHSLHLRFNGIKSLPAAMFRNMPDLRELLLDEKEFDCSQTICIKDHLEKQQLPCLYKEARNGYPCVVAACSLLASNNTMPYGLEPKIYDDQLSISCSDGYVPREKTSITCDVNGSLSASPPNCQSSHIIHLMSFGSMAGAMGPMLPSHPVQPGPGEYGFEECGGLLWRYFSDPKKREVAKARCSFFKAVLATVHNDIQRNCVRRISRTKSLAWVGLTYAKMEGVWRWENNQETEAENSSSWWKRYNQPDGGHNEICVYSDTISGKLGDDTCSMWRPFLCQVTPQQ